jgi:1-deoxy-D-xylulose-5-phosphate synthase
MGMPVGDTIAVIGDGAITAGMAYEAMNHAGHLKERLFVILNDNDMSIAPPVGAMSDLSERDCRQGPLRDAEGAAEGLEAAARPRPRRRAAGAGPGHRAARGRDAVRGIRLLNTSARSTAMTCPAAGTLRARRRVPGPVLIHCVTVKGKGYAPAEGADDKYHGVAKFDVATGKQAKGKSNAPKLYAVFGQTG